ncbi:serine/threonine protein kinase Ran1 [Rhizoclosmatium sp. JEL0117]|nr:serine/threonine protein kinase Ran1 [Rhizoclosmatium sp. JEL0117]
MGDASRGSCSVCECAKCSCSVCRCNVEAPVSSLNLSRGVRFDVVLPTSAALGTVLPSCVSNPVVRRTCPTRTRCAFVDVKYALLRGRVDVKSVVFVAPAPAQLDESLDLRAITVDVYFAKSRADNAVAACEAILSDRGYSVSSLPSPKLKPVKLGAGSSGKQAKFDASSHQPTRVIPSHAVSIGIVGMTCTSCTNTVKGALSAIQGVVSSSVLVKLHSEDLSSFSSSLKVGEASFEILDSALPSGATADLKNFFKDKIEGLGFEVVQEVQVIANPSFATSVPQFSELTSILSTTPLLAQTTSSAVSYGSIQLQQRTKTDILLSGLTCASCVQSLTHAFKPLPTTSVEISLLPFQRALVVHDPTYLPVSKILETIENCGFEVLDHISVQDDADAVVGSPPHIGSLSKSFAGEQIVHKRVSTVFAEFVGMDPSCGGSSGGEPVSNRCCGNDSSCCGTKLKTDEPEQESPPPPTSTPSNLAITKLDVTGMTCASCVASIERIVGGLEGVTSVSVSLLTNRAVIQHDTKKTGARQLISTINDAGFNATLSPATNINSLAQQKTNEEMKAFQRDAVIAGVFAVPAFMISMVFMMAFKPGNPVHDFWEWEVLPGVSLDAVVLLVLATPVQFWMGARFYRGAWKSLRYAKSANMDVLVALGTSAAYFYSVASVILSFSAGMMKGNQYFETSILLLFFILLGKYLESYAKGKTGEAVTQLLHLTPETVTLVHLQKPLIDVPEADSIEIEREETVESGLVEVGDILKVNVGARFPCDAILVKGSTHADESMLTGEPIPLFKKPGDTVTGGTLNVTSGVLVKAVHIGSETVLARIVACVQDAQMSKAPVQAVADAVSRVFVPVVVLISLATFLLWILIVEKGWVVPAGGEGVFEFALNFGIAVLVIACPCALGLATPTAVMVGTGIAAKYGILIKGGGAALQTASTVKTIIFDKTGTLTKGKPTVTDSLITFTAATIKAVSKKVSTDTFVSSATENYPIVSERDLWSLLAYTESFSSHPLATAAAIYALPRSGDGVKQGSLGSGWKISSVQEIAGMGISANLESSEAAEGVHYEAFVGSRRWVVETNGCVFGSEVVDETVNEWQGEGKTAVFVGMRVIDLFWKPVEEEQGGKLLCVLAISDPPREASAGTVKKLQAMGIRVVMMTGDQHATALAVARQVGIASKDVIAGCLPLDKGTKVLEIKEMADKMKGGKVAFAGDGINDSIALASADVGIALGGGSDIAIESASAVLLRSELSDIVTLLKLSRTVLNRIYLNMGGAFIYNIIGIPIAAGVLYVPADGFMLSPWIAGLAMALSSVTVVVSSLALKLFKP